MLLGLHTEPQRAHSRHECRAQEEGPAFRTKRHHAGRAEYRRHDARRQCCIHPDEMLLHVFSNAAGLHHGRHVPLRRRTSWPHFDQFFLSTDKGPTFRVYIWSKKQSVGRSVGRSIVPRRRIGYLSTDKALSPIRQHVGALCEQSVSVAHGPRCTLVLVCSTSDLYTLWCLCTSDAFSLLRAS